MCNYIYALNLNTTKYNRLYEISLTARLRMNTFAHNGVHYPKNALSSGKTLFIMIVTTRVIGRTS